MFVKLSCGYINLDHIAVVTVFSDDTGALRVVGSEDDFTMTADDVVVFRNAIGPPAPASVPTPAQPPAPQVDADKLSEVLKAVADSFYQAYLKDQLFDFDAEDDEDGSDLWPHWKGVRDLVRDVSGVDLLLTSREMAFEQLARWRTESYPRPIQPLTPKKFELPFGITVCRAPGGPPPGSPYAASIVSGLRDELDVTVPAVTGAIEALESLILAHACEGIDIGAKSYVAGVLTAVESISNNYS